MYNNIVYLWMSAFTRQYMLIFALVFIREFHGRLNPLTGRNLLLLSIMLHGCESWILSDSHFSTLESFQAEIGKCILGISKYHSSISFLIGLHWPSIRCKILIRKLNFLAKLLTKVMLLVLKFFVLLLVMMCTKSVWFNNVNHLSNCLVQII